jgi:superfamily II DNA or RNA helicase
VLRHGHLRILIADEVGLGKTIQAGILLNELAREAAGFRGLILSPAGLREQWNDELSSRFSLEVTVADTAWLFERARDLPPDVNPWALPGIYVASLDLVKRPEVLRAMEDVTWDLSIVDEVHGAGFGTARLAAAYAIGARSRRMVLLTATPPDGDPEQFEAIANIGRGSRGAEITVFRRTRAGTGMGMRRKTLVLAVRLAPEEQAMHQLLGRYTELVWREAARRQDGAARLAVTILRKRALSSAGSLLRSVRRRLAILGTTPGCAERQLLLPLADEEPLADDPSDALIGASGLTDVSRERACLEEIATAAERAATRESKLHWLGRLIGRIDEPAVVFTEYRDTLSQIAAFLGGGPLLLHGNLSPAERSAVQRAFNRSGEVLLATDAASEGLNLHERCRLVIHFELPWTPMRLEQRTGRVDRLGQLRPVHEVLVVARDTAERLVLAPLLKRARTASSQTGRSSTLDESRVARMIIEGLRLDEPDAIPMVRTTAVDLGQEAAAEARRVSMHRLFARSMLTHSGIGLNDIAVRIEQNGPDARFLFVVRLDLKDGAGRTIHTEVIPVIGIDGRTSHSLSGRAASAWGARCARKAGLLFEAARRHAAPSIELASRRAHELWTVMAAREREIAGGVQSTARIMVQAGLFDRRTIEHASTRIDRATALIEESRTRLRALDLRAELNLECRIVAIRRSR